MSRRKLYGAALILSLAVNAAILLVGPWTESLHARGMAQPLTGSMNAVVHLLETPGTALVGGVYAIRRMHHRRWMVVLANFGLYFVGVSALGVCLAALRNASSLQSLDAARPGESETSSGLSPATQGAGPAPISRRRFLALGGGAFATAPIALGGYSVFLEPGWVRVKHVLFPLPDLPPELEGLRLVQLTDIHLGPWLSVGYVQRVVEEANALEPDVVLLTGDYVHKSPSYIPQVAEVLSGLRARIGVVAVLGNHDWWEGADLTRREFGKHGIPLIDNSRLFVTPDRTLAPRATSGLCLAGVGDLWEDQCLFEEALGDVPHDMPRILLSHNPDAAEEPALVRGGWRVDLVVSGHTHGGQVRLPFIGPPMVPSRFGSKYAGGLVQGPVSSVFVSQGVGMSLLPVRFGVRPEIALLKLRRQA